MTIYTEQYRNCTINITQDEFSDNPLDYEPDSFGVDFSGHRDLTNIGATCPFDAGELIQAIVFNKGTAYMQILEDIEGYKEFADEYYWQTVYLYDHGVRVFDTASFIGRAHHASWDSGLAGIVFISKKDFKEQIGSDDYDKYLQDCIRNFSDWQAGNCYCYEVLDSNGEQIDICGGYIGDYTTCCLEDAKSYIDSVYNYNVNKGIKRYKGLLVVRVYRKFEFDAKDEADAFKEAQEVAGNIDWETDLSDYESDVYDIEEIKDYYK